MDKLELYLAFFITILLIILRLGQIPFKFKSVNKVDTIPYIHWVAGIHFPLIDGFIGLYKIRTQGVTIFEKYVNQGLKFAKCDIGPKTVYFVADTDIIQTVLKSSNVDHLHKPEYMYNLFSSILRNGLLASNVSTWIPHRKAATQAFTYKSLAIYLQYTNQNAKSLLHQACTLMDLSKNGSILNPQMSQLLSHSLFQLTTQIIMGSEYAAFSEQEISEFHRSFRKSKDITVERFLNPFLHVPPIWWLHPKRRQLNTALAYAQSVSAQVIKKYRETQNTKVHCSLDSDSPKIPSHETTGTTEISQRSTVKENDVSVMGIKSFGCVVEQLIASGLPDQEIIDEVATFLGAGHETIDVALNMLLFHLALYPELQKKCQVEVDQLFDGDVLETRDLTMNDLSSLKYLERCIFESMRFTSSVPFYARELHSPLHISSDYSLEAGSIILMSAWNVHRDPEIYSNPNVFDPDRFLAENVRKRHPYSFIPFSMGIRNCIGWKLALMEMKVYLVSILRHFNLSTTDGLNDVKIFFDITIHPERPYNVTFEKRVQ